MQIYFVTLFPESIQNMLHFGIIGKAIQKKKLFVECINLRDFSLDKHRSVDDRPFGGSPGMLLKADVLARCVQFIQKKAEKKTWTIFLSPQGQTLTSQIAKKIAHLSDSFCLIFICGHYEGVDQRFIDHYVDQQMSIGDFICTGGELPALVLLDVAARFVDGVVGNAKSVSEDTFEDNLLKYPQYTHPQEFEGVRVPEVLLSGHHEKIQAWQKEQRLLVTKKNRPDLLKKSF